MTVLEAIRRLLESRQIDFRELHHEPTYTSEEAARVRGEELRHGGKALLMKVNNDFSLFVLPAERRVHSAMIRKQLGAKKMRFATPEELQQLTAEEGRPGLVPGSVPPFGEPILPFPLYVDSGIRENERIAFNAGSLNDSVIMSVKDYFQVACPAQVFSFSRMD